jgi:oligosaccharyltransferase complex subunit alpha (ribophorin I)
MKFTAVAVSCLSLLSAASGKSTVTGSSSSKITQQSAFQPPQVFENANLVHIISLEKNYAKESINVLVKNVSPEPQDEYYLPLTSEQMERVGGVEVKDRKKPELGGFAVEAVEFDRSRQAMATRCHVTKQHFH